MATGWMKSLQCKSKVLDDVISNPHDPNQPENHHRRRRSLSNSSSCRNSYQNLKDIVETNKIPKPKKPKPPNHNHLSPPFKRPVSRKLEPGPNLPPAIPSRSNSIEPFFPSLMELPKDHPSRNVVEIIFHTSWGEKHFSGQIEMVFKVQNLTRTLNRFEEYRDTVKHRASCAAAGADGSDDHVRCIADGNEVMRFYSLGATAAGGPYETGGGAWVFQGCKRAAVCTYSGSGVAHENAGGGRGRRAMLVCRVVAGRVCKGIGLDSLIQERIGFDSVGGENGELLVFDTRALLPCFLIIYKL
ncbi:hypothetical protein C2S53_002012 [Perilla frutescens var. hirtella]|uniref:Uncharacterized protein n=1 Tax=Perilla frutescens var. hirtella TaxID=608512 RepID=A0AAD4IVX3_PERFH|nr:hypothetical protein C2S53_002012 [Perilla frutescens var. hirtella]